MGVFDQNDDPVLIFLHCLLGNYFDQNDEHNI